MRIRNFLSFLIFFFLINCRSEEPMRRFGYLPKLSQTIEPDSKVKIEGRLRYSNDCHLGSTYELDTNFINKNLEEMANGDDSIIGYRDFKIEYKLYPVFFDRLGDVFGFYCLNFSGYAIRNKEILK